MSRFLLPILTVSAVALGSGSGCSLRDLSHLEGGGLGGSGGTESGSGGASSSGGSTAEEPYPYEHEIVCDGSSTDWEEAEHRFVSTTDGTTYWVAWDREQLSVMACGPRFAAGAQNVEFRLYLGNGSDEGGTSAQIGTSRALLPFHAQFLVAMESNGNDAEIQERQEVGWTPVRPLQDGEMAFSTEEGADFVELCLPRELLGLNAGDARLAGHLVDLADSSSFLSGLPSTTFVDGLTGDVELSAFFEFALDEEGLPPRVPTDYEPVTP